MNIRWGKGFFRAWLCGSAVWVVATSWSPVTTWIGAKLAPPFDPSRPYEVLPDKNPPPAGFVIDPVPKGDKIGAAADRARQAWPGRQLTDAELGATSSGRDVLPDAPWLTATKPGMFDDLIPPPNPFAPTVIASIFLPPSLMLLFGIAIAWISRGFRPPDQ